MSRSQQIFVNETLQIGPAFDRRPVMRHHIAHPNAPQMFENFGLGITRAGRVQQKPADKCEPQSAKSSSVEKAKQTDDDENESDSLAGSGRDASRALGVAGDPPDNRTQHATAIQRKTGNHVKDGEGDIDDAEPNQHRELR